MKKSMKNEIEKMIGLLDKAHAAFKKAMETGNRDVALSLLEQCQDSAIQIGGMIEDSEGEGFVTVGLLENYCEMLYETYEMISRQQSVNVSKAYKNLRRVLIRIENSVKNDISVRTIAVFLPYKASMWDSLESVWRAADADPDCDAYVVPIPYFDKNPDGSFREMHYEGDQYPKEVPVIRYDECDLGAMHPDVIFIHNPYDNYNHVTSVHPAFYTGNLKTFADKLVYISYFILAEGMYESMCVSPGTVYSDVVIAHSQRAKEDYVRNIKAWYLSESDMRGHEVEKMLREKILPLGSPKIDKVVNGRREDYSLPEEWNTLLKGKKAVLYNTGVSGILHGNEQELKKIKDTIEFFAGRDDVVLWWRPHPLAGGTISSMRPQLFEEYVTVVEEYKESGIGIYDDTAELHRALLWTDMYYGDDSSLIYLYGVQGKPIVRQNIDCLTQSDVYKGDDSISYKVSCLVSDFVYFSAWCCNRLFRFDISCGQVFDMAEISQEIHTEFSLYGNMIYEDGALWLVPSRAHALLEYRLNTGEQRSYELPDRIKSSARIDGRLYMISSDYKGLWVMDFDTKKLVKEEIIYEKEPVFRLSDEYYNDDLYLLDHKLYYLITHTNMLAVYDLKQKRAKTVLIGEADSQYQRLAYDGGCFWCLPNNSRYRVACWDGMSVRESFGNSYPKGFSNTYGFLHTVFRTDGVWIFPYIGNMVLRIDRETMRMECALKLDSILGTDHPRIDCVQELSEGRLLITSSLVGMDTRITVLGADCEVLAQYSCVCPNSGWRATGRIFERLDTEKYTSAQAYQINEGNVYSLSRACDELINDDAVFLEEKNYYRSLYANSDGTAGARIWEELKIC